MANGRSNEQHQVLALLTPMRSSEFWVRISRLCLRNECTFLGLAACN